MLSICYTTHKVTRVNEVRLKVKVTRKMVADRAKVSEATVSYVINGSKYVSPEIVKRVRDSITELNYYPDFAARSMVKKDSSQISVYLMDLANVYFGELISGIEKAATKQNYFVNVSSSNVDIKKYIGNVIARRYDGVYISAMVSEEYTSQIRSLLDNGIKVVISNYYPYFKDEVSHIDIDTRAGVSEQIKYLSECGHENIVYLSAFPKDYVWDGRVSGYFDGMCKYLSKSEPLVLYSENIVTTVESGYNLCKKFLETGKKATALMTTNDLMAFGIIECLQEHGIRVPDDISVVGFDNNNLAGSLFPRLTTSGFDNFEFGNTIFDMLFNAIKNDKREDIWLKPKLYIRNTVKDLKN